MLSVSSMLNQNNNTTTKSQTTPTPIRPTALTISHLLCEPTMKTPSLSPSSSPSPTESLPYPFNNNKKPMTPSSPNCTRTNFALHSRPFLPTLHFIEDKKRRSPSLPPYPCGDTFSTISSSSSLSLSLSSSSLHLEQDEKETDELDDDDDQLSLHSKSSSTVSSLSESSDSLKAKRKRANTKQLETLNQVFERTFFPSTQMRIELGKQLAMSPRTVQIWFQNKRQAMRTKERQRLLKLKNGSA